MISVIMPVYNCEKYVAEAVQSILNQTFTDFEFIIIDDGSTDKTVQNIQNFKDKRIKLLKNDANQGLVFSLNRGLNEAKFPYIARMDGDDISLNNRLLKQFEFMESNHEVMVCGTSYRTFGAESVDYIFKSKAVMSVIDVPITHPTAMIRRQFIQDNNIKYNPLAENGVEDLRFWFEIYKASMFDENVFFNIEEILFEYRVHPNQISSRSNLRHKISGSKIRRMNLEEFFSQNKISFKFQNVNTIEVTDINSFLTAYNKLEPKLKNKEFKEQILFYLYLALQTRKEKLKLFTKIRKLHNNKLLIKACLNILGRTYLRRF
jgi:glycosyltransferase involved in cell wall biosynthesis